MLGKLLPDFPFRIHSLQMFHSMVDLKGRILKYSYGQGDAMLNKFIRTSTLVLMAGYFGSVVAGSRNDVKAGWLFYEDNPGYEHFQPYRRKAMRLDRYYPRSKKARRQANRYWIRYEKCLKLRAPEYLYTIR